MTALSSYPSYTFAAHAVFPNKILKANRYKHIKILQEHSNRPRNHPKRGKNGFCVYLPTNGYLMGEDCVGLEIDPYGSRRPSAGVTTAISSAGKTVSSKRLWRLRRPRKQGMPNDIQAPENI
jgi:hypothetical protein